MSTATSKIFLSLFCCCLLSFAVAAFAGDRDSTTIEADWGGHLKLRGEASFPAASSPYRTVGPETAFDGNIEGRLKNTLFWGSRVRLDTQYEIVASGGDTRGTYGDLAARFPEALSKALAPAPVPSDDRRLMSLTRVLRREDDYVAYHRLDRLALTLSPEWGTVTAGRQAVTWGNGFLFNPMDLFNPFSPTDIEREYKIGDDMLFAQMPVAAAGNLQMLWVPRRDPADGDITWDESSVAAKAHMFYDSFEFDLMAAKHYEEIVFGVGGSGYLGNAAWRTDATWTETDGGRPGRNYPSLVANIDYSWVWWGKNLYGFVEFFYSGVGEDDYGKALSDPQIVSRIGRGELFTLGRSYLAGHIRLEVHPLVNLYMTAIANAADPSGVLQPRMTWDVTDAVRLTAGGNIVWGGAGTEYGGIRIPGTGYTTRAADGVYLWLAYYF